MKQSTKIALVGIFAVTTGIPTFMSHIVIPITPSITPSVLYQTDGEVMRNDYASFIYQHPFINNNKPSLLTKKIGCLEGDYLQAGSGAVYCNRDLIGIIEPAVLNNSKVTKFEYVGVIPKGKAFMIGEHPASFDSRYLGFVAISSLKKATPLF